MRLDLQIQTESGQRVPFDLGDVLDPQKLKASGFRKAGFLLRRTLRIDSTEALYWAKNCDVFGFDGELLAFPNLHSPGGPRFMCGSSAYLFYGPAGLSKVSFQVISSKAMAARAAEKFKQLAHDRFGAPAWDNELMVCWGDADSRVVCELHPGGENAYFHWEKL